MTDLKQWHHQNQILSRFTNATPASSEQWAQFCSSVMRQYWAIPVPVKFTKFDPYVSFDQMKGEIQGGVLIVFNGHSTPENHPLSQKFPISPGTNPILFPANLMFRAVHDFFGHYCSDSDFSWEGEYSAFLHHSRMFPKSVRGILAAETIGQASYRIINGYYPEQVPVQMES